MWYIDDQVPQLSYINVLTSPFQFTILYHLLPQIRFMILNIFLYIHVFSVVAVFPPPLAVAKIQVMKMDLETLGDGMEVNDSIVDFFLM